MRSELEFLHSLREKVWPSHPLLKQGIGDDAAVIAGGDDSDWLVSTDVSVEDIHFKRQWLSPHEIGARATAAALSDIAAMGGEACFAWVTLGLPNYFSEAEAHAILEGAAEVLTAAQAALAGGDTSATSGPLFIDVCVMGRVPRGRAILRSGACVGDVIAVSGTLGSSALGITQLQNDPLTSTPFTIRHKRPHPRFALAKILSQNGRVHSLIDVSDGLIQDLGHVMLASGTCAVVEATSFPLLPDFERACQQHSVNAQELAACGGEDYELLMTAPRHVIQQVQSCLAAGERLTIVGQVVAKDARFADERVLLLDADNQVISLSSAGHDHFKRS